MKWKANSENCNESFLDWIHAAPTAKTLWGYLSTSFAYLETEEFLSIFNLLKSSNLFSFIRECL